MKITFSPTLLIFLIIFLKSHTNYLYYDLLSDCPNQQAKWAPSVTDGDAAAGTKKKGLSIKDPHGVGLIYRSLVSRPRASCLLDLQGPCPPPCCIGR
ncbi:hypothetical protein CDAR_106991 [Caerostris darwini]|uniref:Transmembrane protein n=1 Tax=Caerostris darwini TaxID=1538125 RepID=A0AAV4T332_9ARAC|nr:hypothetical protein CDAR_106991 [Caerostris darwini]